MFKGRDPWRYADGVRVPSFSRRERALVRQRDRQLRLETPAMSRNEYLTKIASEFGNSAPAIDKYLRNTNKDNLTWDDEYIGGQRKDFFGYDFGVKDYCPTQSASEQTASTSLHELIPATLADGHSKARVGDATAATECDSSAAPGQKRKRTTELNDSAADPQPSGVSDTLPIAVATALTTITSSSFSEISSDDRQLAVLPSFKRKRLVEEPNILGYDANSSDRTSQPIAQDPVLQDSPDPLGTNLETSAAIESSKSRLSYMSTSTRPGPVNIPMPKSRPAKSATRTGDPQFPTLKPRLIRHSIQSSNNAPDDQTLKQSAHPTVETFLSSLNKIHLKSMFDRIGILTHTDLLNVSLQIRMPQNRDDLRKSLLEQGMTLCDWFIIVAGVQEYSNLSS
ncbi:uncharacterized protein EV420DRAFT_1636106 [Desarmillaria tabescens]|uniref:Uncharacterized protein n=1 Tax=Armillaria tabescens TaxID=1929756 RepID=A0AA39NK88_ARMTA|nr:uncharacterized protein EV420DRAFT_1636106 [Desarmillaria tabescens]KAK0467074.1 hypothetical protein EV420DRAFT_1636106 [Desarmillaria tabescens]